MQPGIGPATRAQRLVAALSLAQKVEQLHGQATSKDFRIVPGIPALCVPDLKVTNGPAGVGTSTKPLGGAPATALPAPLALASTWDPAMAQSFGDVVGSEVRDNGRNLLEAPDVDLARVPYNGRTFEALGEDPTLASSMAAAEIQAVQKHGVIAMVKHFAANNQETQRTTINVNVSDRVLQELYFPPFQAAVNAGVAGVMCSYNKVNGVHSCENADLLKKVLRQQWGFKGFVQSDFGAAGTTSGSLNAGMDLEMPTGSVYGTSLLAAVHAGTIHESQLDAALVRRYTQMFRLGLFDRQDSTSPIPVQAHAATARRIAEAGTVLLRNQDSALPLNAARLTSIAVVGPWADRAATGGDGSSHVNPIRTVTPLAGISARAGAKIKVIPAPGSDVAQAVAAARKADVAVVVVGQQLTEGVDRTSLSLPDNQDALIEAVSAVNPHTIVVVHAGAPILMPWLNRVAAVVLGWYPGQEDGTVTARILFGDADPGGRLPITFPANAAQLPTSALQQYPGLNGQESYSEGLEVGYRHYLAQHLTPLFPFGFGLSYTTFKVDRLIAPGQVQAGKPMTLSVHLANTGTRAGTEVIQAYVQQPSSAKEPSATLQGFTKVELAPGASQTVRLTLSARAFEHWDEHGQSWVPSPGTATIRVGTSATNTPLQAQVTIRAR
jgi:beta-glucosidase